MSVRLPEKAVEGSSVVIRHVFRDENDALVVPNAITWSLRNGKKDGYNIVNSREDVAYAPAASTINIMLYGDDLMLADGSERHVVIDATYDSTYGNDRPLVGDHWFEIAEVAG